MTIPKLQTGRRQVYSTVVGTTVSLGFASGFGSVVEEDEERAGEDQAKLASFTAVPDTAFMSRFIGTDGLAGQQPR